MNYNKIIIDGYNENRTQQTAYVSYFKRVAQILKRDSFVEFTDFFNGCILAVGKYKNYIESQYNKEINEHDYMITCYKQGRVKNEQGVLITNKTELDEGVMKWEEKKQHIIKMGLSSDYKCELSEKGDIVESLFDRRYTLYYTDIVYLEDAITQAQSEFIPTGTNTKEAQQIILPDNLLKSLQENGFIKNTIDMPLTWLKSKSLLAYFVDVANDKLNLKHGQKRLIKPFETMFNVSGLGGCINEYKNKTGQYPRGHKDIDSLFV